MLFVFKSLNEGQSSKKKTESVNFCRAVFSLLDFLTLEDGLIGCPKLLLYAA